MSSKFWLKPGAANWRPAIVGAGFAAAMLVGGTTAASADILPDKDTYLNQQSPFNDDNFGSATTLSIQAQTNKNRRILLAFDLSSLSGCTVTSATLRLTAFNINGAPTVGRTYDLHHIADAYDGWTESAVTWDSPVTYEAGIESQGTVPSNATYPVNMFWYNLANLVNDELDSGDGDGNGYLSVLIKDHTEGGSDARKSEFYSSDDTGDDALKPRLIVEADCPAGSIEPGDFRTQTQGGWGTDAHGNNPGVYRDANFDACFGSGALIGTVPDYSATFTSSGAVRAFLPQGGTPGVFDQNYVDPAPDTTAGVLAGQVLALLLNVGFDECDVNFGASDTHLADLVVDEPDNETVCKGMTVQDVLDMANDIIGGVTSDPTPSEINECVTKINENFVDGTVVGTYLKLQ